jgi:hypothetical protein
MYYSALKGAVCTTFLINCHYWPRRGTNPSTPASPAVFQNTTLHIHSHPLTYTFDPENGGRMHVRNVRNTQERNQHICVVTIRQTQTALFSFSNDRHYDYGLYSYRFYRVLTMVCNTQNYWVLGFCPSSGF